MLAFSTCLCLVEIISDELLLILVLSVILGIVFRRRNRSKFKTALWTGVTEFRKASSQVHDELDHGAEEAGQSLGGIYGKPAFQALTPDNQVAEIYLQPTSPKMKPRHSTGMKLTVFLAQGFGAGRMPFAPGTFGSVVGFLPFVVLLGLGNLWWYIAGVLVLALGAVPLCGRAEVILNQKDPGSIVLDEIVAIPFCFLSWVGLVYFKTGVWPSPHYFFVEHWPMSIGVFIAFRFFDVLKPWPVRQSQRLPAGWGVVVDDLLAAGYVNLLIFGFWIIRPDLLQ